MRRPVAGSVHLRGHAFPIEELIAFRHWAERHTMRLLVELDHCVEGEEYEEVLAFYDAGSALRRWTLWRAADHLVVEPMTGSIARFSHLHATLAGLHALRPRAPG